MICTKVDAAVVLPQVAETIAKLDNNLSLSRLSTMESVVGMAIALPRMLAILFASLGALALLLAVIGVYGVVSYTVGLRRQEIGIRLSLGARPRACVMMLMSKGLNLTLVSLILGALAAYFLAPIGQDHLVEVNARDPLVFVLVPLILAAVATLATWIPASRTVANDPMTALRYE